jgi:hypothetical protein
MKKQLLAVLTVIVLGMVAAAPALAQAEDECAHDTPTIQALRECVVHASAEGHIDSPAVTRVLLAELDAAQSALDRGQTALAVRLLQAFIRTVEAQAGKHIVAEHAVHLVEHTQMVIQVLSQ